VLQYHAGQAGKAQEDARYFKLEFV